ncbi:MAG: hypothetical protein KatS3mg011_2048 [Acidimicrobiia bacterium]|nr:MAG: hypothetical protein KatS3mg011_2048 [Acidimicrobiia bacterium]
MTIEPVSIDTDTQPLDGLLYLPSVVRGSVLLMHGNTMNFYFGPPRFLPRHLVTRGFACLAYNRRGHDVLSNRDSRMLEGGAYQTNAEAIADNQLARAWLLDRGLPAPAVVGHSNGGTLAVRYAVDHPDTPALVLLSAHRGGPDLLRRMSRHGLMAGDRFEEITSEALRLVEDGRGDDLLLVPGWWYVISARTYVDFLTESPAILELAPRIACPVLYLVGSEEPPDLYPAHEFARRARVGVDVVTLEGSGHYYTGHEEAVGKLVADWLDSHR